MIRKRCTKFSSRGRQGLLLVCLSLVGFTHVGLAQVAIASEASPAQLRPVWQVGQRWRLEVRSSRAAADPASLAIAPTTTIWEFTVLGTERLGDKDCFQVECRPVLHHKAPAPIVFWAECERLALMQLEMRIPSATGVKVLVERYDFPNGEPTPVVGLLNAVPIALPLFDEPKTKSATKLAYEVRTAGERSTASGDKWRMPIQQRWKPTSVPKGRLGDEKGARPTPASTTVELRTPLATVRQTWQQGRPWPVFSDNGFVVAQLVEEPESR